MDGVCIALLFGFLESVGEPPKRIPREKYVAHRAFSIGAKFADGPHDQFNDAFEMEVMAVIPSAAGTFAAFHIDERVIVVFEFAIAY